jgi:hypothetical protein
MIYAWAAIGILLSTILVLSWAIMGDPRPGLVIVVPAVLIAWLADRALRI